MPNYKVTKEGSQRVFTIAQVQALRTLYGYAVQLVRNANGPAVFEVHESERIVKGGDFLRLVNAIEQVKKTMKKE